MNIRSRIAPLLLAGIVALGIATVPAVAADAAISSTQAKAKTGSIAVQLVNVKGNALKKRVNIQYGTESEYMGQVRTSAKGTVTLKKLKPGTRYITINAYDGVYLQAVKTKIKVTAGKTTKVALKVIVGGTISGTVRDEDGAPAAGVAVALYKGGNVVNYGVTSAKGTYKIGALTNGTYKVAFNGDSSGPIDEGYTVSYWKNATTLQSATTIKVTQQTTKKAASTVKSVNGSLTVVAAGPEQTVSGTVSIPGAEYVYFTNTDTGDYEEFELVDGAFVGALPYGTYTLATDVYADEDDAPVTYWYVAGGSTSLDEENATPIDVTDAGPVSVSFGDAISCRGC